MVDAVVVRIDGLPLTSSVTTSSAAARDRRGAQLDVERGAASVARHDGQVEVPRGYTNARGGTGITTRMIDVGNTY